MSRLIGDAYIVIYPKTDLFGAQTEAAVSKSLKALKPTVEVRPQVAKGSAAKVEAELSGLGKDVDLTASLSPESAAKIRAQMDALVGQARVNLNLDPASLAKVEGAIRGLSTDFGLGTKLDQASLAAARASIQAYLDHSIVTAPVGARVSQSSLAAMKASIEAYTKGIGAAEVAVKLNQAQLQSVRASLDAYLGSKTIPVQADIAPAETRLDRLKTDVSVLQTQLMNLRANVDDIGAEAKVAALQVKAEALTKALAAAGSAADWAPFEASLLSLQGAYEKVIASQEQEDSELKKQTGLWGSLGLAGPGSLIHITDILNASLPEVKLFDGAIGDLYKTMTGNELPTFASHLVNVATSAHLTTEAAIEFVAVWGPALLGLSAFALAALPTLKDIGLQLRNMAVVSQATAVQFNNLSIGQSKLAQAVKPQVMQLFGEYLLAAGQNGDHLANVLTAIGRVLDDFGAKIDAALASQGTSKFLDKAASDIQGLGVAFTQVGRIIGSLIQDVPGYAEMLLKLGDAALTMSADVIQAINPAIGWFLKLHGAVLYIGLATTALAALGRGATNAFLAVSGGGEKVTETSGIINGLGVAVGNLAGTFVNGLNATKKYISETAGMVQEFGVAETAGARFSGVLEALPFGPLGLAAAAAATIIGVGLYAAFHQAEDASTKLHDSLEKVISASSIISVQSNIAAAAKQTAAQIDQETKSVNDMIAANRKTGDAVINFHTGDVTDFGKALESTNSQIQQNKGYLAQYADESATAAIRLSALSQTYGSTAAAQQLLTLAGVKNTDVAKANSQQWAEDEIRIKATAAAYGLMGQQAGAAGNQLDTLTISTGTVTKSVQTLVSAEQQWLAIITGGDQAFTSFEQGFDELHQAMSKTGGDSATLVIRVGNLKDKFSEVGASMNGTSEGALAVRQAFDAQITAAGTLYGNLQTLAAASGNNTAANKELAQSGKDIVAQLLPLAAGSKEATSEVYALAQIVGYTGSNSFAGLVKWLGSTKGAMGDLDREQAALTESSATLSTAAKNLSGALADEVTQIQSKGLLATQEFTTAQNNLINALQGTGGAMTQLSNVEVKAYYEQLIKAGLSTQEARQYTDALLQRLGVLPGSINDVNKMLDAMAKSLDASDTSSRALANAQTTLTSVLANAEAQGKITAGAVDALTTAVETNQGHVDNSKASFEQFAAQLGISKTQADQLWASLKQVTGTYGATVTVKLAGGGTIQASVTAEEALVAASQQAAAASAAAASSPHIIPLGAVGGIMTERGFAGREITGMAGGGTVRGHGPAGKDSQLAMLAPGELVIPTSHVAAHAAQARREGIPGMASGGVVGGSTFTSDPFVTKALAKFSEPGYASAVMDVAATTARATTLDVVVKAMKNVLAAQAAMGTPGNVQSYKGVVDTVLGLLGQPLSDDVIVLKQMATESGGNPTAVNNSDINAQNGTPSTGLMQVIAPTFAAYAGPFKNTGPFLNGVSVNPEANIYAGLNYAIHRYGTDWTGVLGQGHGYSAGGTVNEPVFGFGVHSGTPYSFAERGPEYVGPLSGAPVVPGGQGMTQYQAQQLIQLMTQQNKLLTQMPYSQARAINQANGAGVRRGYFATSGL